MSTVQALPDAARGEAERALLPYARRAAVGALAADIAHDAGNALFGLVGLLDLLVADEPIDGRRRALLQQAAGDLDNALTPLLRFARAGDDEGARADLAAVTREALGLYLHGERKLLDVATALPDDVIRIDVPPSAALQAVVHLLLACDPVGSVAVDGTSARVGPLRGPSLDELAAGRIAADRGGSLTREDRWLVLRF